MRRYPRRRGNGDEFYPREGFLEDETGRQVYAHARSGRQLYPKRGSVFARDRSGNFYYAKDADGHEYYPVRDNRSLYLMDPVNQRIRLALYTDGTQRYPRDAKDNEYYWREEQDRPFLMRRSTGEQYLADRKSVV